MTRRPIAPSPLPDSLGPLRGRLVLLVEMLVARGNQVLHGNGDRGFIPVPDGYAWPPRCA